MTQTAPLSPPALFARFHECALAECGGHGYIAFIAACRAQRLPWNTIYDVRNFVVAARAQMPRVPVVARDLTSHPGYIGPGAWSFWAARVCDGSLSWGYFEDEACFSLPPKSRRL